MKKEYQMIIVLTAIIGFAGGILAYTYVATSKDIEKNANEAKRKALMSVVQGVYSYDESKIDDNTFILTAKDSAGNVVGYGVMLSGGGFQGPIKIMVGFDKDVNKVLGIEILENSETPGLGNRIVENWFKEQFKGKVPPLSAVKGRAPENEREIQAITGATISSKSVTNIVNRAQEVLRSFLKGGEQTSEYEKAVLESSSKIFGEEAKVEKKGEIFIIRDKSGEILGYACISKALGYEDTITVLVLSDSLISKVIDVKVIKGAEYFTNEKKISPLLDKIKVSKPPITLKEIQTVTGATITQDAIVSAVNSAFENLKKGVNLNGIK